jgi:hypothetical protein
MLGVDDLFDRIGKRIERIDRGIDSLEVILRRHRGNYVHWMQVDNPGMTEEEAIADLLEFERLALDNDQARSEGRAELREEREISESS